MCTESITKNKGLEESEGCGYTMLNLGGTEKFDIAFRFIELLSETTPITLNPTPSSSTIVFFNSKQFFSIDFFHLHCSDLTAQHNDSKAELN
ncbi:hypothetical protein TNCV_858001 [Trichonephila clavipes]|nr:hypothetical protein TNCV_858001 [Trichonephila clavipes]